MALPTTTWRSPVGVCRVGYSGALTLEAAACFEEAQYAQSTGGAEVVPFPIGDVAARSCPYTDRHDDMSRSSQRSHLSAKW
jgi:hypothetical protein